MTRQTDQQHTVHKYHPRHKEHWCRLHGLEHRSSECCKADPGTALVTLVMQYGVMSSTHRECILHFLLCDVATVVCVKVAEGIVHGVLLLQVVQVDCGS